MSKAIVYGNGLSSSFLLALFIIGGCASVPEPTSVKETPLKGSFVDTYSSKALEYEKVGELRKALQMWEIVSSFSPGDMDVIKRIDDVKKQADAASADHFSKGLVNFKNGSIAAARKEFLLTLLYNPDHADALEYLKNKLAGDDFILYEVNKDDTLQSISRKTYNDPQKSFLISYFNDLDTKTKLSPGMALKLPVVELSVPKRSSEEEYWKPTEIEEPQPPSNTTRDVEGLLAKAESLFKAKKYQESLSIAEDVLQEDSQNSRARDLVNASNYQMAKTLSEGKNYKDALIYFNRVDPNYKDTRAIKTITQNRLAEIHYNTGVKYFVNDQLEDAIREWEETLALNPKHPKAGKDIENAQNLLNKLKELK